MTTKKISKRTFIPALIGAATLGVIFTVGHDLTDRASAVEYYYQEGLPPIEPVGLLDSLPDLKSVVKRGKPCVINISTKKMITQRLPQFRSPFRGRDPFFDDFFERFFDTPRQREQKSLGSGFIINEDGHALTNRHVIAGADEINIVTSKGKKYEAKLVGEDDKTDIAVLKVKAGKLPFCPLGDSEKLEVGEWVLAMGNPFGLESTVTAGIVSAKGRVIGAGPYDDFIQTDASINPGNSGGPLFDLSGRVVGINTAIVASGQGIGFAIPINLAKDLVPQLITSGKVTRGWLGVGIQDMTDELAKSFGFDEPRGGLVANVFPGSPAEKGGIKSGDIIVEYNGKRIKESHELPAEVARTKIGARVPITVIRDGERIELTVKIVKREDDVTAQAGPSEAGQEGLGIGVRNIPPEEKREMGLMPGQGGVYITRVEPDSPATRSDIRPGDVLISINGKKVNTASEYAKIAKRIKKGQVVRFFVRRGDATIFFAFTK